MREELSSNATAKIKAAFSEGRLSESVHSHDVSGLTTQQFVSRSLRKILGHVSKNTWLKVFISLLLRATICLSLNVDTVVKRNTVGLCVVIGNMLTIC